MSLVEKQPSIIFYCLKWDFIDLYNLYIALFLPNTEFLADSTVISNFRGTHKNNSSA